MSGPDLNCDLGEGADDAAIMPWLSRASIACGGHSGNRNTIIEALGLAKKHAVAVGAHPSYPDLENFGRVTIKMPPENLAASLREQLLMFAEAANLLQLPVSHVKAHGALYHDAAFDPAMADLFLQVCRQTLPDAALLLPPGSPLETLAKKSGCSFLREIFADRNYDDHGRLLPRTQPGAVLSSPEACLNRLRHWQSTGRMETASGNYIQIPAETICLHGDHPGAARLAMTLRQGLIFQ